ncbi:hypothetical protein ACF07V_38700 [Streptomyces sp. NPDC015661]|uniref:hypothetical protein n=1 Tax=Streptomyces sp. NPDC015661 TaxID=3364961 RepID=UPI003701DCF6
MSGESVGEALRYLVPPPAEGGTPLDRDRMRASWGREFPADYRKFVETYGAGSVEGCLVIQQPAYKDAEPTSPYGGMLLETINAEAAWARERKSPQLEGTDPVLIAWGVTTSSDLLCWDASDGDPAAWPVLVRNRDDDLWRRYDCGMVAFLVRVLRAEFDECPLGDLTLWGRGPALFLTETEQKRLWARGVNPWEGKGS